MDRSIPTARETHDAADVALRELARALKSDLGDAISRLYYHLFYHVRALLLSKGLEAKSHRSMFRLFSLHFVREGIFPTSSAHLVSKLMKYREDADDDPAQVFTDDDFAEPRAEAVALTSAIRAHLGEAGYQ